MQLVPASPLSRSEMGPLLKKLYELYKKSEANDKRVKQLEETIKTLTSQNKALMSQLWETRQRTQRIENVLLLIAGYLKESRQDVPAQAVRDNLLSITHLPEEGTLDDPAIDDILKTPPHPVVPEETQESPDRLEFDEPAPEDDNFDFLFE